MDPTPRLTPAEDTPSNLLREEKDEDDDDDGYDVYGCPMVMRFVQSLTPTEFRTNNVINNKRAFRSRAGQV